MFGGYNVLGKKNSISRKFTGLRPHHKIVISFKAFFLGYWDGSNTLDVQIDGVRVKY